MKKYLFIFIKVIILLTLTLGIHSLGWFNKSHGTIYVSSNIIIDGTGHRWFPRNNLASTLDLISVKDEELSTLILSGTHKGTYEIPVYTKLKGIQGAQIKGTLLLSNKTEVEDMAVSGSGFGISINNNSHVTLRNVEITQNTDNGIDTGENVNVDVFSSEITYNTKGIYVRRNSTFRIENSTISSNAEEGIDLRIGVIAKITSNIISHNGEGGIEYILGDSVGEIANNNISENKASGIALQYYPENQNFGNITFSQNTIRRNNDHGIKCDQTKKGRKKPTGYYRDSFTLDQNIIKENGDADLAKKCL